MRNLTSALLLLLAFRVSGNAQSTDTETVPDTLRPETVDVRFYESLDSVQGDTIFTLSSPRVYVIESRDRWASVWVAVKTKKGYTVFDGCPGQTARRISCDTINFNGEGNNELIIYWEYENGRGGFVDGWHERASGFFLWDIDKTQLIFSMQDQYDYNYWSTGAEFDSLGNLIEDSLGNVIYNDSLASAESSCENYNVDIGYRKITVAFSLDCVDAENETDAYDEPAVYIWVKPKRKR